MVYFATHAVGLVHGPVSISVPERYGSGILRTVAMIAQDDKHEQRETEAKTQETRVQWRKVKPFRRCSCGDCMLSSTSRKSGAVFDCSLFGW